MLSLPPLPQMKSHEERRAALQTVLMMVGSATLGAVVTIGAIRIFRLQGGGAHPLSVKLAVILLSLIGIFVAIFIHELGHVLFALRNKFTFYALAAGPLWISSTEGKLGVRFNRILPAWGGITVCLPQGKDDVARRTAWMALGGPIVSLGFALVAAALLLVAMPVWLRYPIAVTAIASLGLFLVTSFLPFAGRGLRADGRRARDLLRGDAAAIHESALLSLQGASLAGEHPRDWPADLVESMVLVDDGSTMTAAAMLLAFQHHFAHGHHEAARAVLVRAIEVAPRTAELMRPSIAAEAALFELWTRRDRTDAAAWLEIAASGSLVDASRKELLRGLDAALGGRPEAAAEHFANGRKALRSSQFGVSLLDQELLEAARTDRPA